MKIEDNHYTYRIETKDSNGGSLDFIDIDTVEPLRCAYDVQDELNLETNEHIKRVEEVVLDANSTEFWYVDEARTSNTHLVCYFEEVELMASKDHPMVDTNRSVFEYGKINSNEHQNTNFICTHVMDNGVSRLYMSIDKETFEFATYNNETIKHFISSHPVTVWYALRYEIIIPRSMSKGHLLTLGGQTDITLTTTSEQAKLPIMKFNIGDTQYTLDNNPIHINNTQEGTQIRNIVLEGNTPINYARGNGANTTEQVSNTRYDFEPFYDGQATIQGTVEGGYVSAKLYGDTMVNIAKPYGESPLLTATNESVLCDDLLGMNEEGIVLADGEITEGRIYGDSMVNHLLPSGLYIPPSGGNTSKEWNATDRKLTLTCLAKTGTGWGGMQALALNDTQKARLVEGEIYTLYFDIKQCTTNFDMQFYGTSFPVTSNSVGSYKKTFTYDPNKIILFSYVDANGTDKNLTLEIEIKLLLKGSYEQESYSYMDSLKYFNGIGSVINPCTTFLNNSFTDKNLFNKDTVTVGYTLNTSTGEPSIVNSNYSTSDFIFVAKGYNYRVANDNCSEMCFYDLNKNFISSISRSFTPTQNGYIRFVYGNDNINIVMFGSFSSTNPIYTEYQLDMQQATLPYTLNKLPNGVADYIDVVNKVHVQRVGRVVLDNTLSYTKQHTNGNYTLFVYNVSNLPTNTSYRLDNMLCDKLTVENYNNVQARDNEFVTMRNGGSNQLLFCLSNDKALGVSTLQTYLTSNPITVLYQLATPIYTPLTEEEVAQLPLSAYADGYVNLSSDQLMPSFEFRMRASNRYQVDMLETGYYYLNAPVGNVKLGTANVDVQQMPCIVKVDNVGTGDSGYRLGFDGSTSILSLNKSDVTLGYYYGLSGELLASGRDCAYEEYIPISTGDSILINQLYYTQANPYSVSVILYDSDKNMIERISLRKDIPQKIVTNNVSYFRFSCIHDRTVTEPTTKVAEVYINPITLAKLPSHRIPTSFTQCMKCATDFGYWEGIKVATGKQLYVNETNKLDFAPIELNRIEYGNTIIEDEFDIATGKLTKRIGKYIIDGNSNISRYATETATHMSFGCSRIPNFKKGGRCIGFLGIKYGTPNSTNSEEGWNNLGVFGSLYFRFRKDRYSQYGDGVDGVKAYFNVNPTTIYYELEVPEISYVDLPLNTLRALDVATTLQVANQSIASYLLPQVKPSHLTYPVPSLVGNRTYTVIHNRKNITGSTKPIELNLGGTVVQLNDASSKALVKTPSTLAHSNLIFIGGESTVDHIMVLDGDWTNKPIEYFENMMGHDTDAIITIIGNGQIDDVEEQYLW